MTVVEVMEYLKEHSNEQTKNMYIKQGAKEPIYGVKLADLKVLTKKIKTDHNLALKLYNTGNSDAMYLAGLIVDVSKVTELLLEEWVKAAYWEMLSERSVAVVAVKSGLGFTMARKWINSNDEQTVCAGYSTYSTLFSTIDNNNIDLDEVRNLLDKIANNILKEPIRVQNAMNNCLIMAGIYIDSIHSYALELAQKIGKIKPIRADNSCNIQSATDYLNRYKGKEKIKNLNR